MTVILLVAIALLVTFLAGWLCCARVERVGPYGEPPAGMDTYRQMGRAIARHPAGSRPADRRQSTAVR